MCLLDSVDTLVSRVLKLNKESHLLLLDHKIKGDRLKRWEAPGGTVKEFEGPHSKEKPSWDATKVQDGQTVLTPASRMCSA